MSKGFARQMRSVDADERARIIERLREDAPSSAALGLIQRLLFPYHQIVSSDEGVWLKNIRLAVGMARQLQTVERVNANLAKGATAA
jgi:hypothetical protein